MAPPKKIIALTPLELNQYQICLFRREGKNKWHIVRILIENAPKSKVEAIEKMKLISEQLKIPWLKKPLKDVTRKRLHNSEKREERIISYFQTRLSFIFSIMLSNLSSTRYLNLLSLFLGSRV